MPSPIKFYCMAFALNETSLHSHLAITIYGTDHETLNWSLPSSSTALTLSRTLLHSHLPITVYDIDPDSKLVFTIGTVPQQVIPLLLSPNRTSLHSHLVITIVALTMNCSLPSSSMAILNKWLLHPCPPFPFISMALSLSRTLLHSHLAITVYRIDPDCKVVFTSPVALNRWLLHSSPSITIYGTDPQQNITTFPLGHYHL